MVCDLEDPAPAVAQPDVLAEVPIAVQKSQVDSGGNNLRASGRQIKHANHRAQRRLGRQSLPVNLAWGNQVLQWTATGSTLHQEQQAT